MKDILLMNKTSKVLYKAIKELPINDYHNHLDPQEIYENKPFENISNMWLDHDHYKWRLMRFSGFDSHNENTLQRFKDFIESLETAYLNPLYIWSQMELNTFFEINIPIKKENAKEIYNKANEYLRANPFGPKELLKKMNVNSLCTTDDITSDLKYHKLLRDEGFTVKVLPTFRPDRLLSLEQDTFMNVITELEEKTQLIISDLNLLKSVLQSRLRFFEDAGCKLADHGITSFVYEQIDFEQADILYKKRRNNKQITQKEIELLNGFILHCLFTEYSKRNWTVQLHLGALRNQNTKGMIKYGKDAGFDSISGQNFTNDLNKFLNSCNNTSDLPRTIIYPLNINQYEELASVCANFSLYGEGHVQLGAAWWMNDHLKGIERQLTVFSEYLNLGKALGMLTDSRSFLSFVRHDYYRRILCNFIGERVENGLIPFDIKEMIELVSDIAYRNSSKYLGL